MDGYLAFIFGVLPFAWTVGPGSEMGKVLGITVFRGMLGVPIFSLFLTPAFYVALLKLSGRPRETSLVHEARAGAGN
ncbi:efflux RND transporter permease subunit [Singulisphaera rosea]